MTNREANDHFTAELLSELYVSHPVPIELKIAEDDEFEELKVYSLRFLSENGYLRYEQDSCGYSDIRFTERGLGLLEMPSPEGNESVGQSLVEAFQGRLYFSAAGILSHILILAASR